MNEYDVKTPYGNYQTKGEDDPYQLLMKMSSWNKELRSTVSEVQLGLSEAESQILQNANEISQRVSYIDYTGEKVTSLIVQDAASINFLAQQLNLRGLVTFTNIGTDSATVIHGGNILSKTILSESISVATLSALSANLGTITAGIINGIQINSANISVQEDVRIGRYLTIGYGHDSANKGILFTGTSVSLDVRGDTLNIGASDVVFNSNVDFSNRTVTGLNIPSAPKLPAHQEGATVSFNGSGDMTWVVNGSSFTYRRI